MRASTVVAILCLTAKVSLFVALPLPASQYLSILLHLRCSNFILLCRFERAGSDRKRPFDVAFEPVETADIPDRSPPAEWDVRFADPYQPPRSPPTPPTPPTPPPREASAPAE